MDLKLTEIMLPMDQDVLIQVIKGKRRAPVVIELSELEEIGFDLSEGGGDLLKTIRLLSIFSRRFLEALKEANENPGSR